MRKDCLCLFHINVFFGFPRAWPGSCTLGEEVGFFLANLALVCGKLQTFPRVRLVLAKRATL